MRAMVAERFEVDMGGELGVTENWNTGILEYWNTEILE
jgi:hypothetical protein